MITGALCGLAGTYLAIAQSAGFRPRHDGGQAYIALAALISRLAAVAGLGAAFLSGS